MMTHDLHALVYVSTAVRPMSLPDIDRLLEVARNRNATLHVTGVLLYDAGHFMQYLEGPAPSMARVYESIKASSLHHGIIELLRERIDTSEFPEWSMAFRSPNASGMSHPAEQGDLLSQRLTPSSEPVSPARQYLAKFWARGRAPSAF
jgi:Sensors of blue-light using FAD